MLNASKILLVLPDVAFAAELLPQKKPNTFSIQTCAQFNSDFFSKNTFVNEKLLKLFQKLEKDEPYQVVLSDEHFINEIVSVKNESDAAIKEELKAKILPSLSISTETHEVVTTVLTEHKGETRIQITAIEKTLLAPLRLVAEHSGIGISAIIPLSWALKGLVSLEPSVTVAQLGSQLYIALHYIGVSQCVQVSSEDTARAVEIIKGFKKSEPSTMTVYALTNELIEQALKDGLKDVIPVQQMADTSAEQSQLPAATTASLEFIARSLSIPDFPIPLIAPGKSTKEEIEAFAKATASVILLQDEEDTIIDQGDHMSAAQAAKKDEVKKDEVKESSDNLKVTTTDESDLPKPTNAPDSTVASVETPKDAVAPAVITTISGTNTQAESETVSTKAESSGPTETVSTTQTTTVTTDTSTPPTQSAIDLTQFAGGQSTTSPEPLKPVQSKDGGKPMMKMILITLGIFIVTVAVGVGVGLLILRFSSKPANTTPTVTVEPTPTAEPMPDINASDSAVASDSATASGSATSADAIKRSEKVLVVNATTKAGYAGTIRDTLVKGGFANTTAGNAKGTYTEKGNFVYLKTEDATIIDDLESASGLVLTEDAAIGKTEDPAGTYAVVIVLNE